MIKKILLIIIIFILSITQLIPLSLCDDSIEIDTDTETIDVNSELFVSSQATQDEIKTPDINSRAYVVIDRKTNTILYGKNENEQRKMASTTKIMTATIIIENCNLNETIEVSKKAAGTGGSRLGLKEHDKITIKDLLYGLMLRSGNDAAVALAEYAGGNIEGFCDLMNKKALELGLNNSHFESPHGLDSDGHYTTAYELALLSNYALENKTFAEIVGTKTYTITLNGYPKTISNTNELLGVLNGVYGIKTGFTNGANRCLVTACKRNDLDIICVVLGADTKNLRTSDSIKLINYIFDNFKIIDIEEIINNNFEEWKKTSLTNFTINKGISQNVSLELGNLEQQHIPIRKDYIDNIKVTINCDTTLNAPITKNTKIGVINIYCNDNIINSCNIYISNNIDKKNIYYYLNYMIKNLPNIIERNLI